MQPRREAHWMPRDPPYIVGGAMSLDETTRLVDPTFASEDLERRDFTLELPGRGTVAGLEWNPGGSAGRVAIVHGLGEHARRYGRAVGALVGQDFAVEAIDLPGHGESYGPRGHVESWGDYRDALDAWWCRPRDSGSPPVAILGHSLGSLVALDYALRHPDQVRAMVLSAPPFELVLRATMLKVRLAQAIVRFWPGYSQQTTILPSMLSHDQAVVRAHNVDPLIHYRMTARLFFEFQTINAAMRDAAARISMPALVLHGSEDVVSSPLGSERWVRTTPRGLAEFRLYPGLYHEILNEPEGPRIASEIADWVKTRVS